MNKWQNKKFVFLGDSITFGVGTTKRYFDYLKDGLGIIPYGFGIDGAQYATVYNEAEKATREVPDADCVVVFAGTNDFNGGSLTKREDKPTFRQGVSRFFRALFRSDEACPFYRSRNTFRIRR